MSFSRRYVAILVVPALLLSIPLGLYFLGSVARFDARLWLRVSIAAYAAYLLGAVVFAIAVAPAARRVEEAVAAQRDTSEAMSRCLTVTATGSALLWLVWGLIVALAGSGIVLPTFFGIQEFCEAALIVAALTMAWGYWAGKRALLGYAGRYVHAGYIGRSYSVGWKIAMVFIGFFVVSTGALVLVICARVAERLGDDAAYELARFALVIAVLTAAVFAIATWFLARDITRPMRRLVAAAHELAIGRFDVETPIFADDEVGKLARSFGQTREDLRTLVTRVTGSGSSITDGVTLMTAGTETLLDSALEQTALADESTVALGEVRSDAESVLSDVGRVADLTVDSAGRAVELRSSFAEVNRRMDELFSSVEKSSSASTEIDASARDMASRTMEVSSVGNDVLAFVAQMDATVEQITRTAQNTASLSEKVKQNAATGRSAVNATVAGIRNAQESTRRTAGAFDELQKSIGKIDQILVFIDDVTNRTNLLSLNAAIIAAQAGGNDFGFSVIADEVRQLADRTRSATKEIAGILRSVAPVAQQAVAAMDEGVRNVDTTVELAQNASAALGAIETSADRSLEMTQAISKSLEEQAKASRHLHRVTAKMSDNIAEIHRATEGQAEATRMLALEAERVRDIAQQGRRATEEQSSATEGIARAMESIASDVRIIRDRLERQLRQTEQVASNSRLTLTIAQRNNTIAEQFTAALQRLMKQGEEFGAEVARFRA